MLVQARKLDLLPRTHAGPTTTSSSSSQPLIVASLISDPSSSSLALMLSDSSLLLYPSLSPFSPSAAAAPTAVPPVSTAACFVRLLLAPNSDHGRVLFLSASPLPAGAGVLLRAWILLPRAPAAGDLFAPARLNFKRDLDRSALALDLRHGLSVRLAGSVNVLVLHSLSANQIWVLAARLAGEDGACVCLTKCAVIDCTLPIYSVGISMGLLLLGEVGGVRVFPLRPLIKGRTVKQNRSGQKGLSGARTICSAANSCKKSGLNGVVVHVSCAKSGGKPPGPRVGCCSGNSVGGKGGVEGRVDADRAPCKLRTTKLRQNSGDRCSFFVEMSCAEVQNSESDMGALASVKAVSIHVLSQKKFLILDSAGDIHHVNLQSTLMASETAAKSFITSKDACTSRLDYIMKVQMLAVLPDISTRTQVIWLSDGGHSVHMMSVADMESPITENDKDESEEKAMQISAIQAIFPSDKVQDIVPLSANAILILGQGNIYAYVIA